MRTRQLPQQARALATFEKLINAAQDLLEKDGFEALTSNAVVERAGLTPPAFYRYFPNKHALLEELGQRLMDSQNDVIFHMPSEGPLTKDAFVQLVTYSLTKTMEVTRNFRGGFALLVLLRAVPKLQPVRLESHDKMAKELAARAAVLGVEGTTTDILAKCRLAIEIGYATIEMLFETNFKNQDIVLQSSADAQAAVFGIS